MERDGPSRTAETSSDLECWASAVVDATWPQLRRAAVLHELWIRFAFLGVLLGTARGALELWPIDPRLAVLAVLAGLGAAGAAWRAARAVRRTVRAIRAGRCADLVGAARAVGRERAVAGPWPRPLPRWWAAPWVGVLLAAREGRARRARRPRTVSFRAAERSLHALQVPGRTPMSMPRVSAPPVTMPPSGRPQQPAPAATWRWSPGTAPVDPVGPHGSDAEQRRASARRAARAAARGLAELDALARLDPHDPTALRPPSHGPS
ncbi:MAG: hypothetical protein JJT89_05890 [Nitriliruptoraceae bacterium]|nr:hypothetical protein [Nitriliruptoraceae bacterium]